MRTPTKQELLHAIENSGTITEVSKAIGWHYFNGKMQKKLLGIIAQYGLDASKLDKNNTNRAKRKYPIITKSCPVCQVEFSTEIGSKEERTTCSWSCSNKHFPERHEKAKLTWAQKSPTFSKNCEQCSKIFECRRNKRRFCNISCASSFNSQRLEYKEINNERLAQNIRKRIASGEHKGWSARKKGTQSFPEKVTQDCLLELGFQRDLHYICELKNGKWFIDFAFTDRKIAIEIDGQQHQLPERMRSDAEKDQFLTSEGWSVHRISWKRLNKDTYQILKQQLQKILI